MISPNSYYTVQAWMVNDLGLKGNELALYAIIYGFSQDGRSEFMGSISYIQEWLGCSKNTAKKAISNLADRGLIKRKQSTNGIDSCSYKAVLKYAGTRSNSDPLPGQILNGGGSNSDPLPGQILTGTGSNSDPYNYIDNNTNNYTDKESKGGAAAPAPAPKEEKAEKSEPVKHRHGEYKNVLLTDEELDKLKELFPADLQDRIERLSEYIASTGKKYKSHYATIRAWANRDGKPAARPQLRGGYTGPIGPNGVHLDPTKNDLDGLF